jgi:hypothetical protein
VHKREAENHQNFTDDSAMYKIDAKMTADSVSSIFHDYTMTRNTHFSIAPSVTWTNRSGNKKTFEVSSGDSFTAPPAPKKKPRQMPPSVDSEVLLGVEGLNLGDETRQINETWRKTKVRDFLCLLIVDSAIFADCCSGRVSTISCWSGHRRFLNTWNVLFP